MSAVPVEELITSLELGAKSFAPDELAYLALTSKVERPLQDRLAWALHTRLPELVVAREWRRCDIAVLNSDASLPLLLLEAKAMYSFDLVRKTSAADYAAKVKADLDKMRVLDKSGAADTYALVLATHPFSTPQNLPGVIKYDRDVRAALHKMPEDGIRRAAANAANRILGAFGPVRKGSLSGGSAFGTQVAVDYWLVGPPLR
ncbi:hypothetical protein AB0D74_12650 [Streptomyces sp. NPDC048278]|uniref:hypothetical protein n=1 Tax=Streptomyces sp. NPDC048278 TaxID=3155809 RepID=UPI003445723A